MRKILVLSLALLAIGCHNTNPEQGSGGKKVDQKTTLSSSGIVDSTKALLDQSFALKQKYSKGEITEATFEERHKSLMTTYKVLFKSLSPADTLIISNYRTKRMQELLIDTIPSTKTKRWQ